MQRIQNKRFWVLIGALVVFVAISIVLMLIFGQSSRITAEAVEKWAFTPDTGITVNISDGVDEVKAGDLLNYKIDFAYEGQKVTTQEDFNQVIDTLVKKLGLNARRENVQVVIDGFLATGKVQITEILLKDKSLSQYQFPTQVGTVAWLLRYPNFEMVVNQLKSGTSGTLNIPAIVPQIVQILTLQNNKIYGIVYVYLTTKTGPPFRRILVAKAIDEDTLIGVRGGGTPTPSLGLSPSPRVSPTPTTTPSPTANLVSLEISPRSLGFAIGGQQIAFTAVATYSDGSRKEVTRDSNIQWEAVTTKEGTKAKSIGKISAWGVLTATIWNTAGINVDTPPIGKIKATFGGESGETTEFTVLPKYYLL